MDDGKARQPPRRSYWAVIPAPVRYDDRIPASSKVLYAEISALCEETGYCWADNRYFAEIYQMTERSIRRQLAALADCGYIRIEETRGDHNTLEERRIYAGLNPLAGVQEPLDKKVRPLDKKVQRHIINNNNIPPISPEQTKALQLLPQDVADSILTLTGKDAALLGAWLDFAEVRRAKRTPIRTVRTVALLEKKLLDYGRGDADAARRILEQSIERGWTGVFPLKGEDNPAPESGEYWGEDPEG